MGTARCHCYCRGGIFVYDFGLPRRLCGYLKRLLNLRLGSKRWFEKFKKLNRQYEKSAYVSSRIIMLHYSKFITFSLRCEVCTVWVLFAVYSSLWFFRSHMNIWGPKILQGQLAVQCSALEHSEFLYLIIIITKICLFCMYCWGVGTVAREQYFIESILSRQVDGGSPPSTYLKKIP